MKKIFTLTAALLASFCIWAETESNPTSDITKDTDVTGTSYTLPGIYNAGQGNKCGDMQTKGIKFRLNKKAGDLDNAVEIKVNEDYLITRIDFCGNVNDNSKTSTIKQVLVDGTPIDVAEVNLPNKNSSVSFAYDIEAKESFVMVFEGEGTQANLEYTITYEAATPSTDPVLRVNPEEVQLIVTANEPKAVETVTFSGKNLEPGTYGLAIPELIGLTVAPETVTVGEDGKLSAEVTLTYAPEEEAFGFTEIGLTIGELSAKVDVIYSASFVKNPIGFSLNIEQWILDNGKRDDDFHMSLGNAGWEWENINQLDSLNDSKDARNEPFLGLKLKTAGAFLAGWLSANDVLNIKFGHVENDVLINGVSVSAETLAEPYRLTVTEDTYIKIETTTAKTVVIKQLMLNEEIAPVILPDPQGMNKTVVSGKATKRIMNGQLVIEKNGTLFNALGAEVK